MASQPAASPFMVSSPLLKKAPAPGASPFMVQSPLLKKPATEGANVSIPAVPDANGCANGK